MTGPEIILDVDLDAGFRAVSGQQLAGTWQIPAELVRMAIAHGASEVEIKLRRTRLEIHAPGAVLPAEAIRSLAALLRDGAAGARLRALAHLETKDATALGWAVGADPGNLRLDQKTVQGGVILTRNKNEQARTSETPPSGSDRLRIVMTKSKVQTKRALSWLKIACRFSEAPVWLNGVDLRSMLESGCFRTRFRRPIPATVALGVALESPRLWLLRHGILETRVTVPGWPAFEAAVELSGEVHGFASSADLRRVVSGHLPEIFEAVVDVLLKVVPRFPTVSPSCRTALTTSLLTAVEKKIKREDILRAPLLECVDSNGSRWVSLDELTQRRSALPVVVETGRRIENFDGPCLRMGSAERMRTAALLDLHFRPAYDSKQGLGDRLRKFYLWASDLPGVFLGPSAIPEKLLEPIERDLLRNLSACIIPSIHRIAVAFVPGNGRVRRSPFSLRLPRDNQLVRACVGGFSRDPRWLYPVALALGLSRMEIKDDVYGAWICDDGQKEPQF